MKHSNDFRDALEYYLSLLKDRKSSKLIMVWEPSLLRYEIRPGASFQVTTVSSGSKSARLVMHLMPEEADVLLKKRQQELDV